uniref:Proline-rich receptor-like protein kinase PERK12 n=1 Tax=Anthurium amnicola TaxID=1678845 RepID=A0A1D1Z2W1_9ARAE
MERRVIVAYDATKDRAEHELARTVDEIWATGYVLLGGDTLLVLGVLGTVPHPMGYQIRACTDSFAGTNARALEEETSRKVDIYERMLVQSAERCEREGVSVKVKITAGTPAKKVILQEVLSGETTWVVIDRHFRRDLKFYLKHMPCKVALIQESLSVEVMKPSVTNTTTDVSENKSFYSLEKLVQPYFDVLEARVDDAAVSYSESFPDSLITQASSDFLGCSTVSSFGYSTQEHNIFTSDESGSSSKQERTGKHDKEESRSLPAAQASLDRQNTLLHYDYLEKSILCAGCGLKSMLYTKESMRFRYSDIQAATSDFSKENLLGEGGFGLVYKGQLKDGQTIAAKLRKEASTQGYSEFFSEVHILSIARHKNIVMLLGYCCKENHNILVYEYICNKSLEWHLFNEHAQLLEWHKRYAIAIGIAKGLRFLHEECRGGPIIHRDLRPSNILLTHDFIPMIGDFGLAKWKSNDDSFHTRVLGTSGYLAPEYAEQGIVSVRTDVYAFGVVLFQLISGREIGHAKTEAQKQHLLQWAEPLVEKLVLHELIDPRIGESYDTFELYRLARTAYLCVRHKPGRRPSMGEVLRLLEGENDHVRVLAKQFIPHYKK